MTIRHLKAFICVYDQMSITRAANALHMTQPVVTRTIKELESHYGVLFFERINHRLHATEAGKRFYMHAKKAVEAFDALELDTLTSSDRFSLRLGSTYYLGCYLLPLVIQDFNRLFPQADLHARVMNAGNLQKALMENELDFIISEDQIADANLHSEVFFKDRLILLLPKKHPLTVCSTLTVNDLQNQPFLLREPGSNNRRRIDELLTRGGVTVRPVLESYSTQALLASISAGIGLSILPEYLAKPWVDAGLIESRPLLDEPMVRSNYIIWHKEKHLTPQIYDTMKLCHQAAVRLREQDSFLLPSHSHDIS